MAGTVTEDLRIELSFETYKWKEQTTSAAKDLDRLNHRFNTTSKRADRAKNSMRGFTSALGAYVSLHAGKNLLDTALAFDRVENRMKFATNGAEDFASAMQMTEEVANRLGLSLVETQRGFSTIAASAKGTALEGESVNELFKAVTNASAALSLTADETNSVFLAFSQIISKGKVAAEELRGQIGERLPGAFNAAARSLGVTNQELDKMLQDGTVIAEDFLPKFAKELNNVFSDQAIANSKSMTAQINQIGNGLKVVASESVNWLNDLTGVADKFANISKTYNELRSLNSQNESSFNNMIQKGLDLASEANKEYAEGNITLTQRLKMLNTAERIINQLSPSDDDVFFGREGAVDEYLKTQEALAKLGLETRKSQFDLEMMANKERQKSLDLEKKKTEEFVDQLTIAQRNANILRGMTAIEEEQRKQREQAKFPLMGLSMEQQMAIAKAGAENLRQLNIDEKREKSLSNRLEVLKKEEQILRSRDRQVNFVSSAGRGSAADIRANIEARTFALGAAEDNQAAIEENLEEQRQIKDVLKEIRDNLKPVGI